MTFFFKLLGYTSMRGLRLFVFGLFFGFFFTLSLYLQFFEIFYNPVASINYHGMC